jgi:uncharacterized lipoprotein YmbA
MLPWLALLAGCSFLKPHSDSTRYFVLTSEPAAKPGVAIAGVVGLDRIVLAEYLERPEMVARSASNQLVISDVESWGEPLKEGFARALRRDLENDLGTGHVVVAPFEPTSRPHLLVDVDVLRFERVAGEGVLLEAHWTLRSGKSGATLTTREARLTQPLSGSDAQATVAALSRALAGLAEQIAETVRQATSHEVARRGGSAP